MNKSDQKPLFGNAAQLGEKYRGWFIGPYVEPKDNLCHNEAVEIKCYTHPKGDSCDWKDGYPVMSLSILVRGKFEEEFEDEKFVLQKEGDFILFGPGVRHKWKALEESVVFTVRWPEKKS